MNRPTFGEGAVVAASASLAGGVLFGALTSFFATGLVVRLLIAGFGLAYVIYLLSRCSERVGRLAMVVLWLAAASAIWWLAPSLLLYLLLHVAMIWVIRSLYFYSSALSSLADLGVNGLAVAAGIWGGLYTHSAFLSVWCFFLTQALFVAIPAVWGARKSRQGEDAPREDRFEQAHRAAESALRKYSSSH